MAETVVPRTAFSTLGDREVALTILKLAREALPLALERLAGKSDPVDLDDQRFFWMAFEAVDNYVGLPHDRDEECNSPFIAFIDNAEELMRQERSSKESE